MLTLKLIRKGDPSQAAIEERPFKGGRLTIGRGEKSLWRLDDEGRQLSKIHCEIFNRGEQVFLSDCSTNGVFLNGSAMRMRENEPVAIRDGDRFALGPFEVVVLAFRDQPRRDELFGEAAREGPLDRRDIVGDWLGEDDLSREVLGKPSRRSVADLIDDIDAPARDPFARQQGPEFPEPARGRGELSEAFMGPILAGSDASSGGGAIPADWDEPDIAEPPPSAPRRAPAPAPAADADPDTTVAPLPAAGSGGGLSAFLEGAGLDPAAFERADGEAVLRQAGAVYRQAVLNFSDILRDRSFLKNEFRIDRTIIGAEANNPLKFTSAQQAAVDLLLAPAPGFLNGPAAMREAGEDVKKHQIAVLSGLRVALQALLDRFRPAAISKSVAQKKQGLLPDGERQQALRAWEKFKTLHQLCEDEATGRPDNFLNAAFRRGYEAQLEKLEDEGPR